LRAKKSKGYKYRLSRPAHQEEMMKKRKTKKVKDKKSQLPLKIKRRHE
jgi:hypothetical protein